MKGPFDFDRSSLAIVFVPGLVLKSLIRRSRDGIIAALLSGIGSSSIVGSAFKEVALLFLDICSTLWSVYRPCSIPSSLLKKYIPSELGPPLPFLLQPSS
ncbi:hypothetical protein SLE2022_405560 [Rubroshorea leprosula]